MRRFAIAIIAAFLVVASQAHAQDAAAPDSLVKKNAMFPLMQDLVKDRPQLPPPYGVALINNWVNSEWKFTQASIGIDDPNIPAGFANKCTANIDGTTLGIKPDLWLLPFFDVFFAYGYAHSTNQLILRDVPLKFIPGPNNTVLGDVVVDFNLDGTFTTFGGVLAGGYKKFFSSIDMTATDTNFGKKDAVTPDQKWTYSIAPRVGYVVGLSQVWVGARYLNSATAFRGTIPIPSGQNFSFDVRLKTAAWNFGGGMRTIIKKRWELLLDAGGGGRHMITSSVGYRW